MILRHVLTFQRTTDPIYVFSVSRVADPVLRDRRIRTPAGAFSTHWRTGGLATWPDDKEL
jgi:hypothetical protein